MKKEIERIEKELVDLRNSMSNRIGNICAELAKLKQEDKPDTVRLWCANGKNRGHVETVAEGTWLACSDGGRYYKLVKRPAKEGEWARNIKTGEVSKVISECDDESGSVYVRTNQHNRVYRGDSAKALISPPFDFWNETYYEVIENYHSEHEPEPELLQGAVVCIMSNDSKWMKLGKKYIAVDGIITLDDGYKTKPQKSIESFNEDWARIKIARLIEN